MYLFAIVAGLGSFFNPCSIVMLPTFMAFVGAESKDLKHGFVLSAIYGMGFTLLFAVVGTALLFIPGFLIQQRWIQMVGAVLTIIIGIIVASGILNRSKETPDTGSIRRELPQDQESELEENTRDKKKVSIYGTSFTLGLSHGTSGLGCAGPILASVVTAVISSGSMLAGWLSLTLYALGLLIPFLLLGLFIGKLNEFMILKIARFSDKLRIILGIAITGVGIYFLYDSVQQLGIL